MSHWQLPCTHFYLKNVIAEKEKMEARKLKPNVDILEVNIKDKQSLQNVIDWINFKRKMR